MNNLVVCVHTAQAAQAITTYASRIGLDSAVRTVDCAAALFVELRRRPVHAVLIDFGLAAPDPVKFTQAVRTRFPQTGVVLCGTADPRTAAMTILAGARGVLQVPAITGEELLVAFAQTIMLVRGAVADAVRLVARQRQPEGASLTARELEVLKLMSEGRSNAEIGHDLRVTEDTVKTHAKRMYRKLEAHDRAQAVAIGLRCGLLP